MERVGDFVVLAFHDVRDAASVHDHLKARATRAACIDSAYIISRLHLVVALHRISTAPLAIGPDDSAAAARRAAPTDLDVFAALSHTRNLHRALRRLTCSETTRAAVIVLHAPTDKDVAAVLEAVQGTQHGLSSLETYCDEAAVQDFYGVGGCEAAALEAAIVNRLSTSDL
ncbi:uncharacterized protein Tco025E_03924 [Trypanosoma conorhini]|uniref:Kinase binding protein CGI-121 n=1 Tax=Trypanosoma conorhini TaxID=83891 RepID=A0A3R7PHK2_9TRYP|nr:uncharacterized protein Tco025E_03924 [Trypanosoma conorhini]RNF20034.1 hypothetical protein Tco025E_03924 [Trypanosoma conorhini]